jgi:hypothetical protein
MAAKHSDRAVFWGSVNPLEGKKALDLMTRQVEDHGAKAFKFYNVRYDYGQPFPWRMDDPRIAYPVFERAQELGVNLIGVHKGVPLGPQPVEHTRTFDMDGAAANFPDINFVIFHVGLPWLDEVLWQIVRYPNLYASIAATVNFISRQPRVFAETLGQDDVVVRRGQDHLRRRVADLAPAVGARGVLELRAAARHRRGARLPAAHRAGQAQDPRREPRAPARHRRGRQEGGAGRAGLSAHRR